MEYTLTLFYKIIIGLFAFLGINPAHLAAGLLGAAVKLLVDKTRNWIEILTTLFIGAVCASYVTPVINVYVGTSDIPANNGMAFFIGTIGTYATQYVIRVGRRYSEANRLPKVVEQYMPEEPKPPENETSN